MLTVAEWLRDRGLQRLEEELQKAIKEVRLQATQLSDGAPFDKPEAWPHHIA